VLRQPPKIDWNDHALFIDVDGTLLEIEEHPDIVSADVALTEILQDVGGELDGALAVVSGRPIADIDRVFSAPQFVIVGSHGTEIRWLDGTTTNEHVASVPGALVDRARRFVDEHDGLLLEQKVHGFALHYRQAPQLEDACRGFMRQLMDASGNEYRLLEGKMVFEITPLRCNKGTGVRRVMEVPPFLGRVPVYVGDDVTDEDGFHVVNEESGISIRVGEVEATEARFAFDSVSAVRAWLLGIVGRGANN
jgi:trehalose 6-phosphate phosphatase